MPRSWEDSNNAVIEQCADDFAADRVHVIDWNAAASRHRGWFYSDGIHLKPSGGDAFARLLDDSVDKGREGRPVRCPRVGVGRGQSLPLDG